MRSENIRVEITDHGRGRVIIDGVELKGVVAIEFKSSARGVNELMLRLIPRAVEIAGPAHVTRAYRAAPPDDPAAT